MAKITKMAIGCIVIVIIACGLIWWVMPVHFLRGAAPEEVAGIKVFNGNNGDEFEVTDPDGISYIVNTIQQIALKRDSFTSGVDYYYSLTFINENGEEVDSFGIQNPYVIRRDNAFYRCNGELGPVAEYLENIEAALFPDWNKDPDFR